MKSAIAIDGLHKGYDGREVVRGVTLEVAPGEVFCLLGPNGAGKTTTTEILEGYRDADAGTVRVLGHDPAAGERAMRERIGIVLQDSGLQGTLRVGEVLDMYGSYYKRRLPSQSLLDLVELDASRDTLVDVLSGGQRRRLDLALGLVGDPDLIFLDEPTTGFDPTARRAAWTTIRALCSLGKTVWLTTHFMDEAQALADRIAVMVDGRIVASGRPEELGGRDTAPMLIAFQLPAGLTVADLPPLGRGADASVDGEGRVRVTAPSGIAAAHALTGWALERGVELAGFCVAQPTLEDVYLQLTEDAGR
jgi:ABC-2 type transport system ATP-binding protein